VGWFQKTMAIAMYTELTVLNLFVGRESARGADKSLAWPGRKQATVTEDSDFHISYL
jgi:hypothetical protein